MFFIAINLNVFHAVRGISVFTPLPLGEGEGKGEGPVGAGWAG